MMPNPVKILLVLLTALAAALVWLWVDQTGHWRHIEWQAPAPKAPEITVPAPLVAGDGSGAGTNYSVILERPLFAPDRRPPPPPAPPAPPPPPDPLADVQLRGIFSGEQAGILASIEGKVRRIKINESVGSWQLKSIDGRQVTFVQGGQTRQIQLNYASLNTVVPPPPGAGAKPAAGSPGAAPA